MSFTKIQKNVHTYVYFQIQSTKLIKPIFSRASKRCVLTGPDGRGGALARPPASRECRRGRGRARPATSATTAARAATRRRWRATTREPTPSGSSPPSVRSRAEAEPG